MARLRYLQNKRSGAAGTISKADKRIYFFDDNAYIYGSSSGVLNITATTLNLTGILGFSGAQALDDVLTITNTLGANENGVVIDLDAPLATVTHNWTAAQYITIDQTSAISGAWNASGRLMGVRSLVAFNNNITNVFGIYSKITAEAATASKTVNDVQAVVGVIDLLTTGGGSVTQQTTSMVCGLKGQITNTSTTCTWGGACAVIAAEFGPNTTFTLGSALISAWNHAGTTLNQGIHLHPSGTLTVGIDLDNAESGVFTTGINIDSCATANLAIQGTNATGIVMTGTYSTAAINIDVDLDGSAQTRVVNISGDCTTAFSSGSVCLLNVVEAVSANTDITGTGMVLPIFGQIAVEGSASDTTFSSTSVMSCVSGWMGSDTVDGIVHSNGHMLAGWFTVGMGQYYVGSGSAFLAGMLISSETHDSATINGHNYSAIRIMKNSGKKDFVTALDIRDCGYLLRIENDDAVASDTAASPLSDIQSQASAGFIKVMVDNSTVKYIALYDAN